MTLRGIRNNPGTFLWRTGLLTLRWFRYELHALWSRTIRQFRYYRINGGTTHEHRMPSWSTARQRPLSCAGPGMTSEHLSGAAAADWVGCFAAEPDWVGLELGNMPPALHRLDCSEWLRRRLDGRTVCTRLQGTRMASGERKVHVQAVRLTRGTSLLTVRSDTLCMRC